MEHAVSTDVFMASYTLQGLSTVSPCGMRCRTRSTNEHASTEALGWQAGGKMRQPGYIPPLCKLLLIICAERS